MYTVFGNGLDSHENFDTPILAEKTPRTGQAVFHKNKPCFNMYKSKSPSNSTERQTFINCQNIPQEYPKKFNSSINKIQFQNFARECKETFEDKKTENEENKNLENIKNDKMNSEIKISPLCLINELVKFNKITSQYILTDETGPAHKKVFSVKLKLGNEEFSSNGPSIKKAQEAAASEALKCTSYAKPQPKWKKNQGSTNKNPSLTPTVELNALAMKQGKTVEYRVISNNSHNYSNFMQNISKKTPMFFNNYEPFHNYSSKVEMEVEVDGRIYKGQGVWMKQAKNACASAALADLKKIILTNQVNFTDKVQKDSDANSQLVPKSEISQVYEIAYKRQMVVQFEVTKESGPAHMKVYQTTCTCGELKVDGTGNSKKDSKKDSAAKMLIELKQLPPLPTSLLTDSKKSHKKPVKKTSNKTKLQKANPDLREGFHPISRLYQIQQAKKEAEPIYKTIKSEGKGKHTKFLVEVTVGDKTCSSWSTKIKAARLLATEHMLQLLGYVKPSTFGDDSMDTKGAEIQLRHIDCNIESLVCESMSDCPIIQLKYITKKLGFLAQYRDFPKNNDDISHVTLVTLTTIPRLHCHGEGVSFEESKREAAKNSIQQLSEILAHMKISQKDVEVPNVVSNFGGATSSFSE